MSQPLDQADLLMARAISSALHGETTSLPINTMAVPWQTQSRGSANAYRPVTQPQEHQSTQVAHPYQYVDQIEGYQWAPAANPYQHVDQLEEPQSTQATNPYQYVDQLETHQSAPPTNPYQYVDQLPEIQLNAEPSGRSSYTEPLPQDPYSAYWQDDTYPLPKAEQLTTPPPEIPQPRPGAQERRDDNEPRVYRELPSFPSFDNPIPAEASIEEICKHYPNHLRGSYLNAFIQYRWTATDIFTRLSQTAIDEFVTCGISRCKAHGNRANFLTKRLSSRLDTMTPERVTELMLGPKIRGCLMNGGEHYGASKLQGKFFNPTATTVRHYPERQHQPRNPRASKDVAEMAKKSSVMIEGRPYLLWTTAGELEVFRNQMARTWARQRFLAEKIISVDAVYGPGDGHHLNRLILQVANWPSNLTTDTFFSFQHIEECPSFLSFIDDMAAEGAMAMFGTFIQGSRGIVQSLALAREAAVEYVIQAQEARLARLQEFVTSLPAGRGLQDVVKQVLEWDADVVSNGQGVGAEGNINVPQNQNDFHVAEPNTGLAISRPASSAKRSFIQRGARLGNLAATQNPASFNSFNISANNSINPTHTSAIDQSRNVASRKRQRDEAMPQPEPGKRVRVEEPTARQDGGSWDTGLIPQTPAGLTDVVDPVVMRADPNNGAAQDFVFDSNGFVIGNWSADDIVNGLVDWPAPDVPFDWSTVDLGDGFLPPQAQPQHQDILNELFPELNLPQPQSVQANTGLDTVLAPEMSMQDVLGDFGMNGVTGIQGQSNVNGTPAAGQTEAFQVANPQALADASAWDLPVMEDNDEDWLREAIAKAMSMGPPEDP